MAQRSIELKTGQNPNNPNQNEVVNVREGAPEQKNATQTNENEKVDKRYTITKKEGFWPIYPKYYQHA
jgi:hypothetical protein